MTTPTLKDILSRPPRVPSWVRWCGALRLSAYLHADGYHVAIVDHSGPIRTGLCVVDGVGSSGRGPDECAIATIDLAREGQTCWTTPGLDAGTIRRMLDRAAERDHSGALVIREHRSDAPHVAKDAPSVVPDPVPTPEARPKRKRSRKAKEVK